MTSRQLFSPVERGHEVGSGEAQVAAAGSSPQLVATHTVASLQTEACQVKVCHWGSQLPSQVMGLVPTPQL